MAEPTAISREAALREVHERLRAVDAVFIQAMQGLKAQLELIAPPLDTFDEKPKAEAPSRRRIPKFQSKTRTVPRTRPNTSTSTNTEQTLPSTPPPSLPVAPPPPRAGYSIELRIGPVGSVNLVAAIIVSVLLAELMAFDLVYGPHSFTKQATQVLVACYMSAVLEMDIIVYEWMWDVCRGWWNGL